MSESFQEKSEQPTAKREREAREEGKVPQSKELSAAVGLLAAGLMVGPGGAALGKALERLTRASFVVGPNAMSDAQASVDWVRWVGAQTALGFLPFALVLTGAALAVGAGQGRATFTTKPLQPDWSRLSPIKNSKRFLSPRPLVDLIKAIFKLGVVGFVIYLVLVGAMEDLSRLPQSGPWALIEVLRAESARVLFAAGLALLALSVGDYGYQSWQHRKELRMTKEEVRQELKDSEGDPMIRARLRSLGRSLARMRMMNAVPTADVVVTNPTHIAVALRYDPDVAEAPVVVAMGSRKVALRIRRIALEHGVPVIENKPVARALFVAAKIGAPIPPMLYVAVAEILAFVYRHRRTGHVGTEVRA
ncbi:MAG: flagellar biosynthesis protein FlhB [Gemmatimonadetes bacterium]|nr:flagellar biosynthesis protein FlhB [Gemmatimonadota bacterium]NNF12946.1 flagellar biosynthesis protein FlhB [Gemmatimonadota bacterium]